jgi:hypothetical protein
LYIVNVPLLESRNIELMLDCWFMCYPNYYNERPCPKKLGSLVPSGSIRQIYVDPQGRRRPLGRVLHKDCVDDSSGGGAVVIVKVVCIKPV